ncbi:glycosyltransferase family 2 protein [Microlunatus ginsengisoli]
MPVLNEEPHLAAAVGRVLEQDYPGPLEVIMAVGPSRDRTAEIAAGLAAGDNRLRVVDNPAGKTPHALNLAIAASRYDIVVRVDGHGELGDGYIVRAVELLAETGAANVGGVMDAQGRTPFEEAVAYVYTSPYGLGGAAFHQGDVPAGPADTVFLGVFDKAELLAVGGFDESMHRAQDWELNYRLRTSGRLIWFSPELRVTYRPRSSLPALAKQMYDTGKWRREVVRRHSDTASLRYLAPPAAVVAISGGTLAAWFGRRIGSRPLQLGALAPLGYAAFVAYVTATAPGALSPAARRWLPVVLAATHLAWGAGFLVGR